MPTMLTPVNITPVEGNTSVRQMVADVLNATWNKATEKEAVLDLKIANSTANLGTALAPSIDANQIDVPIVEGPGVNIPPNASTTDVMSMYDTKYLELVDLLETKYADFFASHFPNETAGYEAAEQWLLDALQNPDAGIPLAVQDKIFEADRSRILNDASRAGDALLATFASRRFPLPPGAAVAGVIDIQQKAQAAVAESSQKLAILSVEMQKFNIEKLLALRQSAISAAVEYVKALASGPDMASRVIRTGYDAQSKLISSAADFYRAEIQAEELSSKVRQFNSSSKLDADSKNQAAKMALIDAKVKALLTEVQTLGQTTTSLYNNLHASVGINASRNASVGFSYSNDTAGAGPTTVDVG